MAAALIVDDDPDIRLLLRRLLERRGWTVSEAADGEEALRHRMESIDAVLLDQEMPGLRGDEVAVRMRRSGFARPIVFYSAYITGELEARLRDEVGPVLHIVRKTDLSALNDVIGSLSP